MSELFRDVASIDYPIIDADAHVNEPPDLWQDARAGAARASARRASCAPTRATSGSSTTASGRGRSASPPTAGLQLPRSSGRRASRYDDDPPRQLRHQGAPRRPGRRRHLRAGALPERHARGRARPTATTASCSSPACAPTTSGSLEFCAGSGGPPVRARRSCRPPASTTPSPSSSGRSTTATGRGDLARSRTAPSTPSAEDDRFWARAEEAGLPLAVHIGSFRARGIRRARTLQPDVARVRRARRRVARRAGRRCRSSCDSSSRASSQRFPRLKIVLVECEHRLDPDAARAERRHVPALPLVHRRGTSRCRDAEPRSSTATSGRRS